MTKKKRNLLRRQIACAILLGCVSCCGVGQAADRVPPNAENNTVTVENGTYKINSGSAQTYNSGDHIYGGRATYATKNTVNVLDNASFAWVVNLSII